MRRSALAAAAILVATFGAWAGARAECRPDSVDIRGDFGTIRFRVEIADDPLEHARGLMFRESLPRFAGMLFIYDRPEPASFWMRNTLIPLDMIFADETGTVIRVHHDAVPGDLTPIPSGGPVLAVLEIGGGLAAELGIAPGAQMRHPAFAGHDPAWPCD
ncbi:MAG: DUF192 domain-containing protein [Alphaproteobacteria bacterium]|nr:MAG: DUF192 domain-containing protein [Alphaproteobacteria bacterium]